MRYTPVVAVTKTLESGHFLVRIAPSDQVITVIAAAAGVDGLTWKEYDANLKRNLGIIVEPHLALTYFALSIICRAMLLLISQNSLASSSFR